jgi:hypothetical protein
MVVLVAAEELAVEMLLVERLIAAVTLELPVDICLK